MTQKKGSIWGDDLLGRRYDADVVQVFCKGRVAALAAAGRKGAFTLGVDAPYGVGKSYFLKRLYRQVRLRHPAAFVDAWTDDTIDAPWSALLVAVDEAVSKFSSKLPGVAKEDIQKKAKAVLTALAKSAAKKAASYAIGDDGWDDVVDAAFEKEGQEIVKDYQTRKNSIKELKLSLEKLFVTLGEYADAPIFIFVDELDRCRPTYAIKMLEEMKHLFDVSGVVFIIGLNQDQLARSIATVYGDKFDAKDYLRRFVEKTFTLSSPPVHTLVDHHLAKGGFNTKLFESPRLERTLSNDDNVNYITECMSYWSLKPRNVIRVIDAILVASSVWTLNAKIQLGLLMPMIIKEVLREDEIFINQAGPSQITPLSLNVNHSANLHNVQSFYHFLKQQAHSTYDELLSYGGSLDQVPPASRYFMGLMEDEWRVRSPEDRNKLSSLHYYDDLISSLAKID